MTDSKEFQIRQARENKHERTGKGGTGIIKKFESMDQMNDRPTSCPRCDHYAIVVELDRGDDSYYCYGCNLRWTINGLNVDRLAKKIKSGKAK